MLFIPMNSLTSAKLVVKNISKSYGISGKKIGVLSNIDLEVNSGEFVSIIGPNASGKSTLIKIIAGILPADSGSVSLSAEAVPHGHFHFSKSEYRQEKSVAPHGHFHFSKSEYRQEKLVAPHGHFHFSKSEYRQEKSVAPHGHFHFSKSEYRQEKLVAPHGHFHFSKSEYRQEKL